MKLQDAAVKSDPLRARCWRILQFEIEGPTLRQRSDHEIEKTNDSKIIDPVSEESAALHRGEIEKPSDDHQRVVHPGR